MTVKEVIATLSKYPQNKKVKVTDTYGFDDKYDIFSIYMDKNKNNVIIQGNF